MKKLRLYLLVCSLFSILCITHTGCEQQQVEDVRTNWLKDTHASITDTQKIGQLFCLTVDPIRYYIYPDYKETINLLIKKYKPGAINLSTIRETWKLETLNDFHGGKLLAEINTMRDQSDLPLLFGAEFENGAWFWDKTATRFPFPMAIGATQSDDFAYRQGKITAIEAKVQGINWIFAPVVNLYNFFEDPYKIRSFGSDTELVSKLGQNFIKGCQETGVAACIKYFPSEMFTSSTVNENGNLISFSEGIDAGVLSIMCSDLDPNNKAIMESGNTIKEVIRNQLGFDGLIVSALNKNINAPIPSRERMATILTCLNAGYNMLILPETDKTEIPSIDLMLNEADKHNLDMKLIDSAIEKVLVMKDKLKLNEIDNVIPSSGIAGIGLDEYHTTAAKISNESITLVKNDDNILPYNYDNQYIVSINIMDEFSVFEGSVYYSKLIEKYKNIKNLNIAGEPDARIKREVMRRASEADVIICSLFIRPNHTESVQTEKAFELIKNVLKTNDNITIISFYSPYLINTFPEAKGFIATYSPAEHSMDAAIEVIFGNLNPKGKLPAPLSDKYPIGTGLRHDHLN
ncbi:MAG: glycoside hydrolase family 3 C-terminal domain-containing protein [Candidatus Latescibacteria bacterium]|nr:glycoside hydrolase family 3 C-terminal domain-containing protein [Candidatus Latescibacterota bacterium]